MEVSAADSGRKRNMPWGDSEFRAPGQMQPFLSTRLSGACVNRVGYVSFTTVTLFPVEGDGPTFLCFLT